MKSSFCVYCLVKGKFGYMEDVTLVLERDGASVDADFEIVQHLAAVKETLMVLKTGEQWSEKVNLSTLAIIS